MACRPFFQMVPLFLCALVTVKRFDYSGLSAVVAVLVVQAAFVAALAAVACTVPVARQRFYSAR
jgi:hypothetical protein